MYFNICYIIFIVFYISFTVKNRTLIVTPLTPIGLWPVISYFISAPSLLSAKTRAIIGVRGGAGTGYLIPWRDRIGPWTRPEADRSEGSHN